MLTDLFAADPRALPGYKQAEFPDPHAFGFPTVRARGLDPVALAMLDALLSGASMEEASADATTSPVDAPDLYVAPVVTTMSARTVRWLPVVEPDQLRALAEDWAKQKELSDSTPEALLGWLTEAQTLCRNAVTSGYVVFVWNCL